MNEGERDRIAAAVARAERGTNARIGIRIVPDADVDAYERAKAEFEKAGMHAHEHRNAALFLVAPKARRYAVIGDKALHERVGDAFWSETVALMQPHFKNGDIPAAIIAGVDHLGEALHEHFAR